MAPLCWTDEDVKNLAEALSLEMQERNREDERLEHSRRKARQQKRAAEALRDLDAYDRKLAWVLLGLSAAGIVLALVVFADHFLG